MIKKWFNGWQHGTKTLGQQLAIGFIIVTTVTLTVGGVGYFGLTQAVGRADVITQKIKERGRLLCSSVDLARSAQVNFKKQVQEWKNILLRGRDPKDLETYRTRFLEAEKLVGSSLETLARTAASTGAISTGSGSHAPSALIAGHQELSNAYQAALATADFSDPGTPFRIDAAIRGIDRPLSDKLDALAADMERHELASLQAMGTAASARYETLRRATWIVAGLAVLASLWLCFRASRLAPA